MRADPSDGAPVAGLSPGDQTGLTSETYLRAIAETAKTAVRGAAVVVDAESRFPTEAVNALRTSSALGALVPRELGGLGLDLSTVAASCRLLAAECASTAMVFAMHQIQVACVERHRGRNPYFEELLANVADQQLLLASATSESGVGGDLATSRCFVDREGERFVLRKSCPVISYGSQADGLLVTARATEDALPGNQVLLHLPAADVELRRTSIWDALGMRGTASDGFDITGTGAVAQILPEPFREIASRTMVPVSHLLWASVWVGIAVGALARASSLVRGLTSEVTMANDLKRQHLVGANAELQSLRATLDSCLDRYEREAVDAESAPTLSGVIHLNNLKLEVSTGVFDVVATALSVCGIDGYRNDSQHSVGRYLRDAASAALMVHNDRLIEANARLLGAVRPR